MISFTTRNRPHVLEYSLKKTRQVYDGQIIVVDDNSDTKEPNEYVCKKYDAAHIYNPERLGIPRSKEMGFRALLNYDYQYWFDDDCYLLDSLDRIQEAQKYEPHLLYLKEWAHIAPIKDLGNGLSEYSGAAACFMAFTKELYPKMHGFPTGHGMYGGWHHKLSLKLASRYVSLTDASDYIYSFDIDHAPADFDYSFGSSLPQHERIKK